MRNVNAHYERLRIVGSRYEMLPLWAMLRETVNLNSRDKSPAPAMAGAPSSPAGRIRRHCWRA